MEVLWLLERPMEVLEPLERPVEVLGLLDGGPVLADPVPADQESRPRNPNRFPRALETLETLESLETLERPAWAGKVPAPLERPT